MIAEHATREELFAGLGEVRASPADAGTVELIVRRPAENEREVLAEALLDLDEGLVGDRWALGSRAADAQLTLMNARLAQLVAGSRDRWPLAGDQLYVDLDLGVDNLPAGTRLAVGGAVVEVTGLPHTGCAKFRARFGVEALKLVNKGEGRTLRLRGVNARVVEPGTVRAGDAVVKLA
ncbi:MAG TPA: MOSC domain-containing protein [Gaiellaceae bacterium]|nr:MOSC domain-containing protein [Gaiellaceae bacterium]